MTDSSIAKVLPNPQVAVVTGGSAGIGFALAAELVRRGLAVAIASTDATAVQAAVARLERGREPGSGRISGFVCDVRDRAAVEKLAMDAQSALGPIDLWVNNAGFAETGASLTDVSPESFAMMLDIHCMGGLHGCQVAYRLMQQRGGAIYNMLGAGADGQPVPRMGAYATTKAALEFFTRSLALDTVESPVLVAGLSPGLVITEGFMREHAKIAPQDRAMRDKMVNIIGDHPETTAQWASDIMLSNRQHGAIFTWLTPDKIEARKGEHPPRDILSRYSMSMSGDAG